MTTSVSPSSSAALPGLDAASRDAATQLDSRLHAAGARLVSGLSPISLSLAYADWALHLATQPAQAARLGSAALQAASAWWLEALSGQAPKTDDARFEHPGWSQWPWAPVVKAYLGAEQWWTDASQLRGMSPHHQELTRFFARQYLDMLSPTHAVPLANPEVLERTRERQGANLVEGTLNAMDDWRQQHGLPALRPAVREYVPGVNVAVTPGRVVFRNHLVELLQYSPTTATVQREPIFIVPSWIMKYYILDLSPGNSMVKWLVDQGHTVFILSWRNPDESDAQLGMADYLQQGLFEPLAAIARLVPDTPVHAAGYCLGGTLLAIGAAALARPGSIRQAADLPPLATLTLLATETDFSEPGEMGVLIDESQVTLLEDMMGERGFLTGPQMAGSFAYLHSRELVWSAKLRELWLGEPNQPNDLMAWNADVTRMPAAMHSEYLRRCYLRNEIAEDRFPVEGRAVALSDLPQPMFVVSTEKDHVAPWKTVYKIHRLADTEITYVLANGGHNAGIVSEPGHPRRHYALMTRATNGAWIDPEHWQAEAPRHEGSWWTAWQAWLAAHSSGTVPAREPQVDELLGAAPGLNVHMRYLD